MICCDNCSESAGHAAHQGDEDGKEDEEYTKVWSALVQIYLGHDPQRLWLDQLRYRTISIRPFPRVIIVAIHCFALLNSLLLVT